MERWDLATMVLALKFFALFFLGGATSLRLHVQHCNFSLEEGDLRG